jgi:TolB protein
LDAPPAALPPGGPAPEAGEPGSGRLTYDSDRTGNHEIYTLDLGTLESHQLTADPTFDSWWARTSPDRSRILFYRTPPGVRDTDYTKTSLWIMDADGANQRVLRPRGADGWELQGHADWSPDGRHLVMAGGRAINPQLYVTDDEGRNPRQITDRGGANMDPSWSPDGETIVFAGCAAAICFQKDYEIFTISPEGGPVTQLTSNTVREHDPYFSPDGSRITWIAETEAPVLFWGNSVWNIHIMDRDGKNQRKLTDDRHINSLPQWSQDGARIFFHRFERGKANRWNIFSIRPDGSGLTEIVPDAPGNNVFPSP